MVLENLGKSLDNLVRKIRKLPEVDKDTIKAILQELQRALLMSDVKVEICLEITEKIKKQAMDEHIPEGITRKDYIIKILHDELIELLGGKEAPKRIKTGKENVILLVGIQGSGKTTTVGKLSNFYKKKGFRIGVICCDTWRPGAYDQMAQLLDQVGVKHFGQPEEKSPFKIVKKGMKIFQDEKMDMIIIDTAGRHKEEQELMEEMRKMEDYVKPNEVISVSYTHLRRRRCRRALMLARSP